MLYTVETNGQLQPGLSQEWLLTNGMGAFSSSTVVGCNTRRYHGLLCAATLPPVGRIMTLSRVGEIVIIEGSDVRHELGVSQFPNTIHPRGDQYLRKFQLGDFVQWEYEVDGVKITKQLQLLMNRNVIAMRYQIDPGSHGKLTLQLVPFIALRDFHSLRRGTDAMFSVRPQADRVVISEKENSINLRCEGGDFVQQSDWWKGQFYAVEAERGLDNIEDLFVPGYFKFEISNATTITLYASIDAIESVDWDKELELRRLSLSPSSGTPGEGRGGGQSQIANQKSQIPDAPTLTLPRSTGGGDKKERSTIIEGLHRAAADFIVERKCPDGSMGATVIAGYPWFADWGRDTMISLPGLFLTTGRLKEAAKVLSLFAEYVSEGMIPNRFDDYTNEPSYNTVDASLWFIHACFEYLKASNDHSTFEQKLLPACKNIIKGYSAGTRYHIKMDPDDGLITQGDPSTQLTWMDAKCNGVAFTPRQGKAVEINALWYNALRLLNENDLADRVQKSFVKTYWISPFRGLYDVAHGNVRESKIRPNQIFAVSLTHSALNSDQQHAVVEVVRRELLTPYGLRTLAPGDPQFHPKYVGDQFTRDGAYHNGTIWPWLIGAFLEAYLKVNQRSQESIAQAKQWLQPLIDAMNSQGAIGQLSEIYEAQPPHRPVGCYAQAWSVAEVLRIANELKM